LETKRHPLLCTHPETGRRSLYFNGTYVRGLEGPGIEGSEDEHALMRWLHDWTTHIRFTFRHRWSAGDVVIWDNRSTQHVALDDYGGQRRELTRTTVAGSAPAS
jgi:taurine dioxygenase